MNARLLTITLIACLLAPPVRAQEVDVYHALVKSSRVIVLPFLNLSNWPGLRDEVMLGIRNQLAGAELDLCDPVETGDALRNERLRNTAELSVEGLQTLSTELAAAYVLTGTIHRFACTDEAAEISLAARLIYVPDLTVVWTNSAVYYSGGAVSLFSANIHGDTARVIDAAVRRLLRDFGFAPRHPRRPIQTIRARHGHQHLKFDCSTIALVPLANETTTEFGGEMLSDLLAVALYRRGFHLVDGGRIHETLLSGDDLSRGQSSLLTLQRLHDDLAADLVLTGAVSSLTSSEGVRFGDIPTIALELRLIDPQSGLVVWSRNYHRSGDDTEGLFGTGKAESAAMMARDMTHDVVNSFNIVRARPVAANP
jgi:TolB-like protein